jgi:hypothetical protein
MLADRDDLGLIDKHRPGLLDELRAGGTSLAGRFVDQALDLLGGFGRALGQLADFLRDDRKALARLTGAGRLDAGIERQKVGLEGDLVDDVDDLLDLARRISMRPMASIALLTTAPELSALFLVWRNDLSWPRVPARPTSGR